MSRSDVGPQHGLVGDEPTTVVGVAGELTGEGLDRDEGQAVVEQLRELAAQNLQLG